MSDKQYFEYGEEEIKWLKKCDPKLGAAIDQIGHVNRVVIPDVFTSLVHSIVGQQISTKAHETVWERILTSFSPLTAENIEKISEDELQATGITMKKASYIKGLASNISNGSLNLDELKDLSDMEVCNRLTDIKGIGMWTAEMVMIFSLQRMDVLSYSDLGIIRGLRMLYDKDEIRPEFFLQTKKKYSPYGSVASLYLWEIASGKFPNFVDPVAE